MNLGPLSPMTADEQQNRYAEWHGTAKPKCRSCRTIGGSMTPCIEPSCPQFVTEREKQILLQSMIDHLDGIPPLRREVIDRHLIPRKMSYCEFKQQILIPVLLACTLSGLGFLIF